MKINTIKDGKFQKKARLADLVFGLCPSNGGVLTGSFAGARSLTRIRIPPGLLRGRFKSGLQHIAH
ncbi:MAG: hypothetical protein NTY09_06100 [bacterium]|nr:hypothetical protein [bacterium]